MLTPSNLCMLYYPPIEHLTNPRQSAMFPETLISCVLGALDWAFFASKLENLLNKTELGCVCWYVKCPVQ